MLDQIKGLPCKEHPNLEACAVAGECSVAVLGTPCNPFSTQRQKRFHPESVMAHSLTEHTFVETIQFLETFNPISAVMEQTDGFTKPFEKGSKTTPLDRPGGSTCTTVCHLSNNK